VPFRLLGLVAHPENAGALCGQAFKRYAESGTEVTLVCVAAPATAADLRPAARQLGIRDLVLLDFAVGELDAARLEGILLDLFASIRPHVVVAGAEDPAVSSAVAAAVSRLRHVGGGSAALPAKLYYRPSAGTPRIAVTTAVRVPGAISPELFVRAFPDPWVTGVLERDLFAGVAEDHAGADRRPLPAAG
jgi:LmbE family N-acetylglucosaminyl deacetylase